MFFRQSPRTSTSPLNMRKNRQTQELGPGGHPHPSLLALLTRSPWPPPELSAPFRSVPPHCSQATALITYQAAHEASSNPNDRSTDPEPRFETPRPMNHTLQPRHPPNLHPPKKCKNTRICPTPPSRITREGSAPSCPSPLQGHEGDADLFGHSALGCPGEKQTMHLCARRTLPLHSDPAGSPAQGPTPFAQLKQISCPA